MSYYVYTDSQVCGTTITLEAIIRKGERVEVAPGNGIQVQIPHMQGKDKALIARIIPS